MDVDVLISGHTHTSVVYLSFIPLILTSVIGFKQLSLITSFSSIPVLLQARGLARTMGQHYFSLSNTLLIYLMF